MKTKYFVLDQQRYRSGPYPTLCAARQAIIDGWEQDGKIEHISQSDLRVFHGWTSLESWTDGCNGTKTIVQ